MCSLISSPKRGGAELSRLSDNARTGGAIFSRSWTAGVRLALVLALCVAAIPAEPDTAKPRVSKASANRCASKLKSLEQFAASRKAGQNQTTRFTEDEVNSYLALDLKAKYHPSLRSLQVILEENRLQGVASIDFDRLGNTSTRLVPKLLGFLFSGVHTLTARGQVVSGGGKARFRLEQAQFDDSTLPKALVEEIITAVGRKQNPPFDPLQPSELFDDIEKVEVHFGHILVFQ